jgi:hypothetical protein
LAAPASSAALISDVDASVRSGGALAQPENKANPTTISIVNDIAFFIFLLLFILQR